MRDGFLERFTMAEIRPVQAGRTPKDLERPTGQEQKPRKVHNEERKKVQKFDDEQRKLKKSMEEVNKVFSNLNVNFEFQLFDGTPLSRILLVKMIDKETGKLIKVMPQPNFLKFKINMARLRGIFLNQKA